MIPARGVAICSAADVRYFNLLDGLLASLEAAPLEPFHSICILDLGLLSQQRDNLEQRGARILKPGWPFEFAGSDRAPGWFGAMVNRPYLPQLFPGFETYLWLDADTWVQDPACIPELIAGAIGGSIALVIERFGPPKTYRVIQPDGRVQAFASNEFGCRKSVQDCYRNCFGEEKADYARGEITNSGVFALAADSPIWAKWREYLIAGVNRGLRNPPLSMLVEQQALNLAYLEGQISVRKMPWRFNWNMSTNHPSIDLAQNILVDSADGNRPLAIVHLNSVKELSAIELQTTTGNKMTVPIGYRALRQNSAMGSLNPKS